jgi:hypothetical protein
MSRAAGREASDRDFRVVVLTIPMVAATGDGRRGTHREPDFRRENGARVVWRDAGMTVASPPGRRSLAASPAQAVGGSGGGGMGTGGAGDAAQSLLP